MDKKYRNIISGVASLAEIYPTTDYARFVPERNLELRTRGHWVRVGNRINLTAKRFMNEQQNTSKAKAA
jgi:hypothetical protein